MEPARANPARKHFATQAGEYAEASSSGLWKWWRLRERNAIAALLLPKAGESILDAGAGAGYYSDWLSSLGAQTVAADLAPEMARAVRAPAVAADLEQLPFSPVFDAVLCAGALEFCPRPARALAGMAEVLKPGARLVFMAPCSGFTGRIYRAFHRRNGIGIQLFSHSRIGEMAERARLSVEQISSVGFNFVVLLRRSE